MLLHYPTFRGRTNSFEDTAIQSLLIGQFEEDALPVTRLEVHLISVFTKLVSRLESLDLFLPYPFSTVSLTTP